MGWVASLNKDQTYLFAYHIFYSACVFHFACHRSSIYLHYLSCSFLCRFSCGLSSTSHDNVVDWLHVQVDEEIKEVRQREKKKGKERERDWILKAQKQKVETKGK